MYLQTSGAVVKRKRKKEKKHTYTTTAIDQDCQLNDIVVAEHGTVSV